MKRVGEFFVCAVLLSCVACGSSSESESELCDLFFDSESGYEFCRVTENAVANTTICRFYASSDPENESCDDVCGRAQATCIGASREGENDNCLATELQPCSEPSHDRICECEVPAG